MTTKTRTTSPKAAFARHYVEMLLAMAAGMLVLSPLREWALGSVAFVQRPDVSALLMATDMTVGMTVWMRYRRHGWAPVAEMAAAMYVPFLVLFVPLWTGLMSGDTMMLAGHLLMLPAMLVAMLLRREEYSHAHPRAKKVRQDGWAAG